MGVVGILHQSDEQLECYALGRLPEPWLTEVEEHLLVCAACQERVDDLEAYANAMRQAISTEPATKSRWFAWFQQSRVKTPVFLWAGGFVAIIFALAIFLQFVSHPAPLAALQLTAMRGSMPTVGLSRETDITLADAPAGPTLRAEVVDASGSNVWRGVLVPSSPRIALVRQLAPGNYFVRLYADSGKLLHEYGFQVRGNL